MSERSSSPSAADAFKAANLRQRVITAVVIAVAFLALVLLTPPFWFALGSAVIFLIAAWEWAGLAGLGNRVAQVILQLAFVALMILVVGQYPAEMSIVLQKWLIVSMLFWVTALCLVIFYPASNQYLSNPAINLLAGIILLFPTWISMLFLKQQQPSGLLILMVIAIIALADIGAYFAGVRFGKHKLAPKVSPGKSWEGVAGGVLCNLLFAAALSAYLQLSIDKGVLLALVMIMTTAASIVGDLFESMVKRHRGVKDSGSILPGHGGVLDRIDGWMPAIPVFTLAYLHGWVKV